MNRKIVETEGILLGMNILLFVYCFYLGEDDITLKDDFLT
jgi:hypothetical protein